jgi:hypothetical protein
MFAPKLLLYAIEFALVIFAFICFSGLRLKKTHFVVVYLAGVFVMYGIFFVFPEQEIGSQQIGSIVLHIFTVGIFTTAAYLNTKKIMPSIFFAASTCILVLVSGTLISFIFLSFASTIVGSWGLEIVRESMKWYLTFLVIVGSFDVIIALVLGKFYRKQAAKIDEASKQTLHKYLAVCTALIWLAFLVIVFLNNAFLAGGLIVRSMSSTLMVWAFFALLCLAVFALIKYKTKETDLRKKDEYTRNLENIVADIKVADIKTETIFEIKLAERAGSHAKGSLLFLNAADILYIESTVANPHLIFVNTADNEYVTRMTLKEAEQKAGASFIRCHNSYVVNKNAIASIHPAERKLTLSTGQDIDIGRKYLNEVCAGLL